MVFQVFVVQKKQPEQSLKLAIKIKPKKTKMEDIQKIVQFLSEEYKFDADEAYEKVNKFQETLNISHKKTKTKTEEQTRPKVVLPFCGMVQQNWCQAVRKNYGLYTQCSLPKSKDSLYCKTCTKHAQKNNGVPQNGDVTSLPHPKATNYALIMKKLKITREDAELEASKLGWKIPEEQFVETYKKRGRPKRERRIITLSADPPADGDDIIARLLAEAKREKEEPRIPEKPKDLKESEDKPQVAEEVQGVEETKSELSEEEYEEEIELQVSEITIKGKIYYIADEGDALYDVETEEEIGNYNYETEEIEYL